VAEVRKRGDEFWKEFEFYLSDMLVGECCRQHLQVAGHLLVLLLPLLCHLRPPHLLSRPCSVA
jgi:hypothetical protein